MKTRMMLCYMPVMLVFLIQIGGWSQGKYVPTPNEEMNGVWINAKADIQKHVNTSDGWKMYVNISDSVPWDVGTGGIDSKWTDSEGNIWYKSFGIDQNGDKHQELDKLSKSGTVWESVFREVDQFDPKYYPTKIDPMDPNYGIYLRSE
jgi:hypothetical protein